MQTGCKNGRLKVVSPSNTTIHCLCAENFHPPIVVETQEPFLGTTTILSPIFIGEFFQSTSECLGGSKEGIKTLQLATKKLLGTAIPELEGHDILDLLPPDTVVWRRRAARAAASISPTLPSMVVHIPPSPAAGRVSLPLCRESRLLSRGDQYCSNKNRLRLRPLHVCCALFGFPSHGGVFLAHGEFEPLVSAALGPISRIDADQSSTEDCFPTET